MDTLDTLERGESGAGWPCEYGVEPEATAAAAAEVEAEEARLSEREVRTRRGPETRRGATAGADCSGEAVRGCGRKGWEGYSSGVRDDVHTRQNTYLMRSLAASA